MDPVKLSEISDEEIKKATEQIEKSNTTLSTLQYPLNYSFTIPTTTRIKTVDDAQVQTTPRKKLHFINDTEYENDNFDELDGRYCNVFGKNSSSLSIKNNTANTMNLCEKFKNNVMIQSDCTNNSSIDSIDTFITNEDNKKMIKSLQFVKCDVTNDDNNGISPSIPDIKPFPEFMKIPSLWNEKIEKVDITTDLATGNGYNDEQEQSDSQTSGDWEFVDIEKNS